MTLMRTVLCMAAMATASLAHASPGDAIEARKGVTWGKVGHDKRLGIDFMSCWGGPPTKSQLGGCDAYRGDTVCTRALPVLCTRRDDSPRPNYAVPPCKDCVYPDANYAGWIEGHVGSTLPIPGNQIRDVEHIDNLCKASLGRGWKAARFNDGRWFHGMALDTYYGAADWPSRSPWPEEEGITGGWAWFGYGNVDSSTRYWMITLGQPQAHCFEMNE